MKRMMVIVVLLLIVAWTVYDTLFVEGKNGANQQGSASSIEADEQFQVQPGTEESDKQVDTGPRKGEVAPDFKLTTLTGDTLSLSDLRGKKVILNMWATWCPPCRAEMPDMQRFFEDHGDTVEIVAVNLTQSELSRENVDQFVEEFELTFPVVLDENSEVAKMYYAVTIPTSYVIDSKGIIQNKIIGPMSYEWMETAVNAID